jgi:hypothetical protein
MALRVRNAEFTPTAAVPLLSVIADQHASPPRSRPHGIYKLAPAEWDAVLALVHLRGGRSLRPPGVVKLQP